MFGRIFFDEPVSDFVGKCASQRQIYSVAVLFNCYRFGQIAWLVDVSAHLYSGMVGDELDGHSVDDRIGEIVRIRHSDMSR